jgi:alginate O-acetyltransferase complex protein AlgI
VRRLLARLPEFVRIGYVLIVVLVGWVFFRQPTLELAFDTLGRMFMPIGHVPTLYLAAQVPPQILLLIAVAIVFAFPVWPTLRERLAAMQQTPACIANDLARAAFVGAATVLCVAVMTLDQHNPFIYFRF